MPKVAGLLFLMIALTAMAGCTAYSPPANYYENDVHHGYPGPGVADPSAV